jgi:hypothetical protein
MEPKKRCVWSTSLPPSRCLSSTSSARTPRRPSSRAADMPAGPPPMISTCTATRSISAAAAAPRLPGAAPAARPPAPPPCRPGAAACSSSPARRRRSPCTARTGRSRRTGPAGSVLRVMSEDPDAGGVQRRRDRLALVRPELLAPEGEPDRPGPLHREDRVFGKPHSGTGGATEPRHPRWCLRWTRRYAPSSPWLLRMDS